MIRQSFSDCAHTSNFAPSQTVLDPRHAAQQHFEHGPESSLCRHSGKTMRPPLATGTWLPWRHCERKQARVGTSRASERLGTRDVDIG